MWIPFQHRRASLKLVSDTPFQGKLHGAVFIVSAGGRALALSPDILEQPFSFPCAMAWCWAAHPSGCRHLKIVGKQSETGSFPILAWDSLLKEVLITAKGAKPAPESGYLFSLIVASLSHLSRQFTKIVLLSFPNKFVGFFHQILKSRSSLRIQWLCTASSLHSSNSFFTHFDVWVFNF